VPAGTPVGVVVKLVLLQVVPLKLAILGAGLTNTSTGSVFPQPLAVVEIRYRTETAVMPVFTSGSAILPEPVPASLLIDATTALLHVNTGLPVSELGL
jgi:hypothetical protein